jgi:signal transduction histidine kinase/PleD family two-component response regulator
MRNGTSLNQLTHLVTPGAAVEPRTKVKLQSDADHDGCQSRLMSAPNRVNILVVADAPQQLQEVEGYLLDLGQNVVSVRTSRDALRRLMREDFAVILVAGDLEDIPAHEMVDRIRCRKRSLHTPILLLGSNNGSANFARMSELPLVDLISAPWDPIVMRTKVGVYVDLFQRTEAIQQEAAHRMQLMRAQAARQVAEKAMRRSALLAEASRLLSRSLDFDATLLSLHRALVPALADACQLILCDPSGDLWYASVEEQPTKRVSTTGSHARVQMVDPQIAQAVRETIETCHARVVAVETVGGAPNLRRKKNWASAAVAPLIARDIRLGAMICCRRGTRRRFGPSDIVLVEDLAGRAATALDNAQLYQTIREGERRKDEFLAMLGHELRNPLAAITNAGELTRLLSPSDPNFKETLEIIRQQASLMKRLVDDLLDVSRITSGRIQLQKTTLVGSEVVARVAEANSAQFTSRNQTLHLNVPPERIEFEADPCRLEQILSNLLVNASKYTDPDGQIWFGVAREGTEVVFRVKDTGIGIGPDLLPHVFDLFSQANRSLHRSEGGLGIGLTIVKGLADLHGGRVWVGSDGIGRGSQFAVWLPIGNVEPVAPRLKPTKKIRRPTQQRHVLVVEDQPALLHVTVTLLKRLGHDVHAAADGQEALLAVKEYDPEVVFLDIGLPGMDGYEVARSIREEFGDRAPLLVAMTGYGQHEIDRHAGKAKFDCHLVKPVDINAMQELFCQMESGRS